MLQMNQHYKIRIQEEDCPSSFWVLQLNIECHMRAYPIGQNYFVKNAKQMKSPKQITILWRRILS